MKRKIVAQRKFAQGVIVPQNASASNNVVERRSDISVKEEKNIFFNNMSARSLLDVISFQNTHKHVDPIVLLHRLEHNMKVNDRESSPLIQSPSSVPQPPTQKLYKPTPKLKKKVNKILKKKSITICLRSQKPKENAAEISDDDKPLTFLQSKMTKGVAARTRQSRVSHEVINGLDRSKSSSTGTSPSSPKKSRISAAGTPRRASRSLSAQEDSSNSPGTPASKRSRSDVSGTNGCNGSPTKLLSKKDVAVNSTVTTPLRTRRNSLLAAKHSATSDSPKTSAVARENAKSTTITAKSTDESTTPVRLSSDESKFYGRSEIESWMNKSYNDVPETSDDSSFKIPSTPKRKKQDKNSVSPCPAEKYVTVRDVFDAPRHELAARCKSPQCTHCARVVKVQQLRNLVQSPPKAAELGTENIPANPNLAPSSLPTQNSDNVRTNRTRRSPTVQHLHLDLLSPESPHILQITCIQAPDQNRPMLKARLIPKSEAKSIHEFSIIEHENLLDQLQKIIPGLLASIENNKKKQEAEKNESEAKLAPDGKITNIETKTLQKKITDQQNKQKNEFDKTLAQKNNHDKLLTQTNESDKLALIKCKNDKLSQTNSNKQTTQVNVNNKKTIVTDNHLHINNKQSIDTVKNVSDKLSAEKTDNNKHTLRKSGNDKQNVNESDKEKSVKTDNVKQKVNKPETLKQISSNNDNDKPKPNKIDTVKPKPNKTDSDKQKGNKNDDAKQATKNHTEKAKACKNDNEKQGMTKNESDKQNNRASKQKASFPNLIDQAKLVDAPIFYPTEEEFTDPIAYIEKILPSAVKFGLCKIVPPAGFQPVCNLYDSIEFASINQYIAKLYSRWGPAAREMSAIRAHLASQKVHFGRPPLLEGLEFNLPKLYHSVQKQGGLKKVIEKKRWNRVAEEMNFTKVSGKPPGKTMDQFYVKYLLPYDTLSNDERQQVLKRVDKWWARKNKKMLERARNPLHRQKRALSETESSGDDSEDERASKALFEAEDCVVHGRKMTVDTFKKIATRAAHLLFPNCPDPTPEMVEKEYWKLVLMSKEHVCVNSASIDTGDEGYGFPTTKGNPYSKHPWNLKMLAENKGNVLRSLGPTLGVTLATLHLGMVMSTSCWHRDPHCLPWIEYMHSGPGNIWYGIPDEQSENFRKAVETLCPTSCQNKSIWLPSDITMIPPKLLQEHNVSLARVVQNPREYIIVFPKAYSCSIATGYTVSESIYFATTQWLSSVRKVFQELRENCEPTMFSLERLLMCVSSDTRTPSQVLDRVHEELVQLLKDELAHRRGLPELHRQEASNGTHSRRAGAWSIHEQDECEVCRATLFLSKVTGLTGKRSSLCLQHARTLLEKAPRDLAGVILTCYYSDAKLLDLVANIEKKLAK